MDVIQSGTILGAKATTAANIDTAAELLGLKFDAITFDLTGSDFTFDEDQNGAKNSLPFIIVGAELQRATPLVLCAVNAGITVFGSLRGQTID